MLNVYKDLGNYNRFVPYIGAGIGPALLPQEPGFFCFAAALACAIRLHFRGAGGWRGEEVFYTTLPAGLGDRRQTGHF
jgi:hypothetical protein